MDLELEYHRHKKKTYHKSFFWKRQYLNMTALIIARSYKAERLICILHNECTGIYIKFGLIRFSYKNFMQQKLYMKTILFSSSFLCLH